MAPKHPKRALKTYRVVPQKDLTYGVEVSDGKSMPTVITSFKTTAEAEAWILEQKRSDLEAEARRLGETAKKILKDRGAL
jgi:hypothetical protein